MLQENTILSYRTEDRIPDIDEQLSRRLQAGHAGLWEWNALSSDSSDMRWSDQFYKLLGLEPGSCVASYANWIGAMHVVDRNRVSQLLEQAFREKKDVEVGYRILRPGGVVHWLRSKGKMICDPTGKPTGMFGITFDTTEQKRFGLDWRLFRRVFRTSPNPICIVGPDYRYLWLNDAYGSYHRRPASKIIGRHLYDLLGQDVFEDIVKPQVDKCLLGHEVRFESWFTYPVRGRRYMLVKCRPLTATRGQDGGVVMILNDMTEARLAKEELELREQHVRLALQAARVGTWEWDLATNHVTWSDGVEALFGLPSGSFPGTYDAFLHLVHCEDLDIVKESIDRAIQKDEPYSVEFRIRWRDGTTHWLAGQGEVRRDRSGAPVRMTGTVLDITQRKAVEDALRKSEANLKRAQALGHFGSYQWNVPSSAEDHWSDECFQILGLDPSIQTISVDEYCQRLVHPVDQAQVRNIFNNCIREGKPFDFEYRIVRPDGSMRTVHSIGEPMKNKSGAVIQLVGTLHDITERKQAELQLRQLSGRLLQAQDEERRRLARELHDSTAQTLTVLSLRLAMIEGEAAALSARARQALADTIEMIGHASREIRSLSYLLHPPFLDESGLRSAVPWYVDGFSRRSGIKVQLRLPPVMGRLPREIETTLFRIIQECLTNILKHSGSHTASLQIGLGDKEVVLEIRDQGKGLTAEFLGSPSDLVPGLGIGIMGMRERVRQLHGRLDINSGTWGTSIKATLPLTEGVA